MLATPKQGSANAPEASASDQTATPYSLHDLPLANDSPRSRGHIRCEVTDFKVDEELPFTPTDEGEHLLVRVRKINRTTHDVQQQLARTFRLRTRDVGYVGLKDKRSVSTQWFSAAVPAPVDLFAAPDLEILQQRRHIRKLRPSDGCRNHFEILVRDVEPTHVSTSRMCTVPNYFGEQRFGRDGQNVSAAMKWIHEGKPPVASFVKSIYLSSLRSYIFNHVLAARVDRGDWCKGIEGDVLLDGLPSGPLWGRGRLSTSSLAQQIEQDVVESVAEIAEALEWVGLKQQRRPLAVAPICLNCKTDMDIARVRFALPSGSFATSVLRECFDLEERWR